MLQIINTARLQLIPYSLELKKATLTNKAQVAELLAVQVPNHWPGPDYAEALPFFISLIENNPSGAVWDGIIVHTADQRVIGDMGFKGGPDEHGRVEIGYSIIPEYRGHGYATEMAHSLVSWAFQTQNITAITAECLENNTGSIKVLEKIGMHRLQPEENMLKWELSRNSR